MSIQHRRTLVVSVMVIVDEDDVAVCVCSSVVPWDELFIPVKEPLAVCDGTIQTQGNGFLDWRDIHGQ